jgi:phosphocarrier protein HPr
MHGPYRFYQIRRASSMKFQKEVRVPNDQGMHLRAAGKVSQAAAKYTASVYVQCGTQRANAKSIMSVLSLGATLGSELLIEADGHDAQEAVESLVSLVQNGFT